LAVIGAVGYYLYSKIQDQQNTIDELIRRHRTIEAMFTRPHPKDEMDFILNNRQRSDTGTGGTLIEKPVTIDSKLMKFDAVTTAIDSGCDSCMIEPMAADIDDLDRLAEEEILSEKN
jgi:hypothetical protein